MGIRDESFITRDRGFFEKDWDVHLVINGKEELVASISTCRDRFKYQI
ncbi:UNVERIFIED_ORG: hypothetical protein ABIC97_004131 [Peribacillus simplex]